LLTITPEPKFRSITSEIRSTSPLKLSSIAATIFNLEVILQPLPSDLKSGLERPLFAVKQPRKATTSSNEANKPEDEPPINVLIPQPLLEVSLNAEGAFELLDGEM